MASILFDRSTRVRHPDPVRFPECFHGSAENERRRENEREERGLREKSRREGRRDIPDEGRKAKEEGELKAAERRGLRDARGTRREVAAERTPRIVETMRGRR